MKIGYIVDIHGSVGKLEKILKKFEENGVEFIIVGGDVTDFGTLDEAIRILRSIRDNSNRNIYFVPGNCDDTKLLEWEGAKKIHNIHKKIYKANEIEIVGLGGSLITPFHTNIEFSEEEIREILKSFNIKSEFLFVTHSPPHGCKLDRAFKIKHVGSKEIRKFIQEKKPLVVLTGHIHESSGVDKIGESVIVNPGPASKGRYAVIEIDENKNIKAIIEKA